MPSADQTAVYIRRSTDDQRDQHQRDALDDWLTQHDLTLGDVTVYADTGSGASADRDDYRDLLESIQADKYADVVVWEMSRIGRRGSIIQEFFDSCEDNNVTVHITNGKVERIKPDGTNRFVADIVGMVYAEERRQLIRRTEAGLERARDEGKWLGTVPSGFVRTEEGYLRPNLAPDYDDGETGWHDMVEAIEAIDRGDSYRSVAQETPNISRPGLMRIYKDEEQRQWYLTGDSNDDRVSAALSQLPD